MAEGKSKKQVQIPSDCGVCKRTHRSWSSAKNCPALEKTKNSQFLSFYRALGAVLLLFMYHCS